MEKSNFIIYGSYGYTGNLIAELALEQGLTPVLAGRNEQKLKQQATRLNLPYRVFNVDDLEATKKNIQEFIAVIHCAGPFIFTYENMAKACIQTNTHYTDITGEYKVIESLIAMNERAKSANVMLLPGAGFDVVPSDCLAMYLKNRLPDATELTLAIKSNSGASRGTAKTMIEMLADNVMMRDEGKLKKIATAVKLRQFDFGNQKLTNCAEISWGDIVSAWWSTGIPHIETYMSLPKKMIMFNKLIHSFRFIFKLNIVKKFFINKINQLPEGPDDATRLNSTVDIYGEVKNNSGSTVAAILKTPNGYQLTALTTIHIIKKILAGNIKLGFQTPSTAYTDHLILEIAGVERKDI